MTCARVSLSEAVHAFMQSSKEGRLIPDTFFQIHVFINASARFKSKAAHDIPQNIQKVGPDNGCLPHVH